MLSIKKRIYLRNRVEEAIRKKDFHKAISAFKEGLN